MGERKGVNKYYPPDYDPNKGGLNKFVGSHALRERARKLHLGILIIRFEMPYNIWCDGCENHIGMGVRYNAEKKKIGMYYSTPIYQFRMKCHLCDNHFEIKTDPANLDYVIVSGARRQENRWDPTQNEQIVTEDKNVIKKMASDAMFRLEHGVDDKDKTEEVKTTLENLEDLQSSRWKDDYSANMALRQRMRAARVEANSLKLKDQKLNLNIPLLPPEEEDYKMAALICLSQKPNASKSVEQRQNEINARSVFAQMRPKKTTHAAKKDIARQAIRSIAVSKQKSSSNFCNSFSHSNLGIIKKNLKFQTINCSIPNDSTKTKSKTLIVSYDSSESE